MIHMQNKTHVCSQCSHQLSLSYLELKGFYFSVKSIYDYSPNGSNFLVAIVYFLILELDEF